MQKCLNSEIVSVGVFVNESIDNILKVEFIDMIQLHGNESEDYITKLKSLTEKPIIKSINNCQLSIVNCSLSVANFLLFDSSQPGSGKTFDWGSIPKTNKPYFLAGGLNLDNIKQAVKEVKPFAVDISSGAETNNLKDSAKIKELIRRVRNEC